MNIVCAADDNYVPYCGVMLTSLFENNKGESIHIYFLTGGIKEKNRKKLEDITNKYKGCFHYCLVDWDEIRSLPQGGNANPHITLASYNRFFIPRFLPEDEAKAIYLDCDLIITSSLKKLWETDIDNYAVAAVEEYWNICSGGVKVSCCRLQVDVEHSYFNSGVLLINLTYWRKENLTVKFLQYAHNYPERLVLHDQDVLNAVLHTEWLKLEGKWNVPSYIFDINPCYQLSLKYLPQKVESILSPGILHFCSTPKPWEIGSTHPYRDIYLHYSRLTTWKNHKWHFNRKTVRLLGGNVLRAMGLKRKYTMTSSDLRFFRKCLNIDV